MGSRELPRVSHGVDRRCMAARDHTAGTGMAETQAESGSPAGPEADHVGAQVGTEIVGAGVAGAGVAGAGVAGAGVAGAGVAGAGVAGPEVAVAEVVGAEVPESAQADGYESASYESSTWPFAAEPAPTGAIHHVELWVPNLDKAITSWGWLLTELGYRMFQDWPGGRSWRAGHSYIVVEQSPARTASRHDRCRPGLNHLAFHVETRELVDELTRGAQLHGWQLMFADQHPFAGGPQHYAAYLENSDGYEVELVAH
jgi:catechol 2,3-dioxygenase-like lactoylglutathione lyase family enzyme